MAVRIIESFVEGKDPEGACEDILVMSDRAVAVIDGASDESGLRLRGLAGGRFAAEVLAEAIEAGHEDADARAFADRLTQALVDQGHAALGRGLTNADRWPVASVIYLSVVHRQLWRIGDCNALVDSVFHDGTKLVDDAAYSFRAVVNAALMRRGTTLDEVLANDPGHAAARVLFDNQQQLANRPGRWGFGCINGKPVPTELIDVIDLPDECEIVLASDGYPELLPTLAETEARLHELLALDPAAVDQLWTMGKSLRPGYRSIDDRAYVRFALDAR